MVILHTNMTIFDHRFFFNFHFRVQNKEPDYSVLTVTQILRHYGDEIIRESLSVMHVACISNYTV